MLVTLDTLRLDGDPGDSEGERSDKAQQEYKLPLTHYFYTMFPRHLYCLTIYTFHQGIHSVQPCKKKPIHDQLRWHTDKMRVHNYKV